MRNGTKEKEKLIKIGQIENIRFLSDKETLQSSIQMKQRELC